MIGRKPTCMGTIANFFLFVVCLAYSWAAGAQTSRTISWIGDLDTSDFFDRTATGDVVDSAELAFPPEACTLLHLGSGRLTFVPPGAEADDPSNSTLVISDPINIGFDGKPHAERARGKYGLFYYDARTKEVVGLSADAQGRLDGASTTRFAASQAAIGDARGLAYDVAGGRVWVLDGVGPRLVSIVLGDTGQTRSVDLSRRDLGDVRGLALDPTDRHLYVYSTTAQALYEFHRAGALLAVRDLSSFDAFVPEAMVFAPSRDLSDDPARLSLYIATDDSTGSRVTEWSLAPPVPSRRAAVPNVTATLEQTTATPEQTTATFRQTAATPELTTATLRQAAATPAQTTATLERTIVASSFNPPSPDSAGIAYLESAGTLLMSDSEVNEMPIFANANLFEITTSGRLVRTGNTVAQPIGSREPTGVAYNPANDHVFLTNDDADLIYEVADTDGNGVYGSSGDTVTTFDTRAFTPPSEDPEGIAYDSNDGVLLVVDGVNSEVYRIDPGNNGVFDGVAGDDRVTSFDTAAYGVNDPEGVTFDSDNPASNLIYVSGNSNLVIHVSTTGSLVRNVDISAAGARKPAGLGYVPGGSNATLFLAARGVDNNIDPSENDGRIYKLSVPPLGRVGNQEPTVNTGTPGNQAPAVDAGRSQSITLPANRVALDGTVSDDGEPNPPGAVTTTWTQVDGPAGVTFANASATDTDATFPGAGTYVLRLTADDSALSASGNVTVTVHPSGETRTGGTTTGGTTTVEVRVAASSDDAEENNGRGSVGLTSSDLELIDTGGGQTVGLRFNGLTIPQGALITNAYVQFQADETHSGATSLNIEGEDVDNAVTFSSTGGNISSRSRTSARVRWSPAAWTSVGDAGPAQQTPDIAAVIQEIVARGGWSSGNSLAIIITGTGKRTAKSFNGLRSGAALLHVEYR